MAEKVIISDYNNLYFSEVGFVSEYNTVPDDRATFNQQIRPWMDGKNYFQPIQNNDRLNIQIWDNGTSAVARLYTCLGVLVRTDTASDIDLAIEGGYTSRYLSIADYFSSLDEGNYYIDWEINFGAVTKIYRSENIQVLAEHEGTGLLEYKHNENKFGFLFQQSNQFVSFRLQSALIDQQYASDTTTFTEQDANIVNVYDESYDTKIFAIGGDGQSIPDSLIRKINAIWTLNVVCYEGVRYIKNEGATMEKETAIDSNLQQATLEVRPYRSNQHEKYLSGSILLATIGAYPFFIIKTSIGDTFSYETGIEITDITALNSYIATLNDAELPNGGLYGNVELIGSDLVYNIAAGEEIETGFTTILSQLFNIIMTADSTGILPLLVDLYWTSGGETPYAIGRDGTFNYGYFSLLKSVDMTGIYLIGGNIVKFYHNDNINGLSIQSTNVSSVSGSSPANLGLFYLGKTTSSANTKLTSFGLWDTLKRSRDKLVTAQIFGNSNLTTLGSYYNNGEGLDGWQMLKTITITTNKLSTTTVDSFLNNIYDAGLSGQMPVTSGTLRLNLNTPSASPTGASVIARNYITFTKLWTLITD